VVPYLIGIILLTFAIISAVVQRRAWAEFLETDHNEKQRLVQAGHKRRRMQMSLVMGCLGLGFSLSEFLQINSKKPILFGYFWLGMSLFALCLGILGTLEFFVVRFKTNRTIKGLNKSEQALMDEMAKYQEEQESSDYEL
jgi:Na+/H+ antiporter NhaD/arsenite permease-like protein